MLADSSESRRIDVTVGFILCAGACVPHFGHGDTSACVTAAACESFAHTHTHTRFAVLSVVFLPIPVPFGFGAFAMAQSCCLFCFGPMGARRTGAFYCRVIEPEKPRGPGATCFMRLWGNAQIT